MTCANLQGSRVQIYEGTSESCVLATFRGVGCMQYKCASGYLDLFLVAFVAKRAVCWGNRSGRVVGAAKRVCGNRAVKCRRPQSAVYNLQPAVCGGQAMKCRRSRIAVSTLRSTVYSGRWSHNGRRIGRRGSGRCSVDVLCSCLEPGPGGGYTVCK